MKIVIPGGTGQVGTILARSLHQAGHEVVVLSRQPAPASWRQVYWDAQTCGEWCQELETADVVINLAGRSVNCRYNPKNRHEILESRVNSTKIVGEAIARCQNPPALWLQASTATIYCHRFDEANRESNGVIGGSEPNVPDTWKFSIDVAKAWEMAFTEASTPYTRKVLMRSAIVMSPDPQGAFDILLWLVRLGLGGASGNGKQFVSWIHEEDFIRAVNWIIEHPEITGAINLCAPHPLPNSNFMAAIRHAWGMKLGLPAMVWMLEIGARVLGTETERILKSRRVEPERLLAMGFEFKFAEWGAAAKDLCTQVRGRIAR